MVLMLSRSITLQKRSFFSQIEKLNDPFLALKKFSPDRFLALDSTVCGLSLPWTPSLWTLLSRLAAAAWHPFLDALASLDFKLSVSE